MMCSPSLLPSVPSDLFQQCAVFNFRNIFFTAYVPHFYLPSPSQHLSLTTVTRKCDKAARCTARFHPHAHTRARTRARAVYLWASCIAAIISLCTINRFTLPVATQRVFCAVRTKFSDSGQMNMRLQTVGLMCHT